MRVWLVVLVGACGFPHGNAIDDGGVNRGDADSLVDMMPDTFDPKCFGKAPFTVCLQDMPTNPLTLPSDINTSSSGNAHCTQIGGEVVMVSGVEVCALAGTDVTSGIDPIGVSGARPLVVVATGTLTINSSNFDATSGNGGEGPGANSSDCSQLMSRNGGTSNGGGGGGAGGSFAGAGGNGGAGANGAVDGGQTVMGISSFDKLRGGCAGGDGGAGQAGGVAGGSGGGVVYFVSRDTLSITGKINASGAGGEGGDGPGGGGGGGGSGGMIVLFAQNLSISVTGRVFANGGGGGGGAGNSTFDGTRGGDGLEPHLPALGGPAGDPQGTDGGNGEYDAMAPANALFAMQGGGGGGGGIGVIRILSGQSTGWAPLNVSPIPKLN